VRLNGWHRHSGGACEGAREAEGLLAQRSRRTTLAQAEIDRIAEFHYAEEATVGAADNEALVPWWLPS
jgi:hypothetical protein